MAAPDPDVALLSALADPVRLSIVRQLGDAQAVCACDFTECCTVSQPTISHHLKILHEVGLVDREKRGTWVYYTLNAEAVEQVRAALELPRTLPRVPAGSTEAAETAVALPGT